MPYPKGQLQLGPELINNSQEAWLGYYVFTGLGLLSLAGAAWLTIAGGITGAAYVQALGGAVLLALVSFGIGVNCHLQGHILDTLEEIKRRLPPPASHDGSAEVP